MATGGRRATGAVWSGIALAVLLGGCAHHAKPAAAADAPPAAAPVAEAGLSAGQRLRRAIDLLRDGNAQAARPELVELLRQRPGDRRATLLLRTIDTDPRELYGSDSFALPVRPGDTMFSLARRYLGDPLNFYGLSRFNGIAAPTMLAIGQTIQIPGHPRAPKPEPAPRPRRGPAPSGSAATAPAAAAPSADPARARALRAEGLEQMSAGSIDRAVSLLSQASSLAPDDARIAADLARARRIQATVHAQ